VFAGLFGGLGLFLYSIQMMASGMQKVAGDNLRRILEVLTGKPIIGVLTGIAVTVLVQSSSTTTVMLVGFVNAGLMSLAQAVSAIMGANIGTTITAQVVSFEFGLLILPCIGIGGFLNFFGRRKVYRYLGQTILGLGLLFLGMQIMSEAMLPLRENAFFLNMLVRFGKRPLLGILFAALFTALIQSSSAVTGIVVALTLQNLLTLESAIPLILGTNVGTCITAILACMGTSLSAKRAAFSHVLFNLLGVVLALIFLKPFTALVLGTSSVVVRQVANAHTLFNVLNTVIMFPFFKYFVSFVQWAVPGEEPALDLGPKYLDKRMLKAPSAAIEASRMELIRMANMSREMVKDSMDVFYHSNLKKIPQVLQMEELVDGLEKEINVYLRELSQHSLNHQQSKIISGVMSAANDLERISDHACNIAYLSEMVIEDKLPVTPKAKEEIFSFFEEVDGMLGEAIMALMGENIRVARGVIKRDNVVDERERILRRNHIDRVNRRECLPRAGVVYLDILSNLERVGDHAVNLAQMITGEF
jgi:phosphate:Na+ symporter